MASSFKIFSLIFLGGGVDLYLCHPHLEFCYISVAPVCNVIELPELASILHLERTWHCG